MARAEEWAPFPGSSSDQLIVPLGYCLARPERRCLKRKFATSVGPGDTEDSSTVFCKCLLGKCADKTSITLWCFFMHDSLFLKRVCGRGAAGRGARPEARRQRGRLLQLERSPDTEENCALP